MAPPPGSRIPCALRPGYLLAGRYRLERTVDSALADPPPATLWLARDEVLQRPVAAKVLPTGDARGALAAQDLVDAAGAAGTLAHPVLARVYDAALDASAGVAYVVSEWVDGVDLATSLAQDGPWQHQPAVVLAERVADALAAAHRVGLVHGRLHPGNVLLGPSGSVVLTDLAVAAALPGRRPPRECATGPADDVRDLAAVLYAVLTARWPVTATPQPAAGLATAPTGREGGAHARPVSPAQVRAGVPRALDGLVVRALDPGCAGTAPELTTASGFATVLTGAVPVGRTRVPSPRRSGVVRRLLRGRGPSASG